MKSKVNLLFGKSKVVIIAVVVFFILGLVYFSSIKDNKGLIQPQISQQKLEPKITDSQPEVGQKIPKEVKYDNSTNLEMELDNIKPEVKDEDFSQLKSLIGEL